MIITSLRLCQLMKSDPYKKKACSTYLRGLKGGFGMYLGVQPFKVLSGRKNMTGASNVIIKCVYQYSNMAPRLSGQSSLFIVVFFVSKSLLGIDRQKKLQKLQFWAESLGAMLEYWTIERGLLVKKINPRPENSISVTLSVSPQNFRRPTRPFYTGLPPIPRPGKLVCWLSCHTL